MKYATLFYAAALGLAFAPSAQAEGSKLTNCDTKPHHVRLNISGEWKDMDFSVGHSEVFNSPSVAAQSDNTPPMEMNPSYDYCIWKDGIAVQNRNHGGPNRP
jgi:hypothetical protein